MSESSNELELPEDKQFKEFRLRHVMVAIICVLEKYKKIKKEKMIDFLRKQVGIVPSSAKLSLSALETRGFITNDGDSFSLTKIGEDLASLLKAQGYCEPLD